MLLPYKFRLLFFFKYDLNLNRICAVNKHVTGAHVQAMLDVGGHIYLQMRQWSMAPR